ncbi:MAG: serine hydrolase domain-containing protein [Terracidiphilus sp.]|jgi:CubicO group peptidase (beta-lactamase class C family)
MQPIQHSFIRNSIKAGRILFTILLTFVAFTCIPVFAQPSPAVAGDYAGILGGALHVKLHIKVDTAGAITGTLDSTDQGAIGIPCAEFHVDGQTLAFTVPAVRGTWKGTVTADGLTGTWDQGAPQPLNFTRDTFVPAAKPSSVDGIWLGTLTAGSASLRIQLHIKSDSTGHEFCTLDSVDQGAMGNECAKAVFVAADFSFEVPILHGSWSGKLSADGNTLTGTWSQGSPLTLNFTRQSTALAAAPIAPPKFDPALPPVSAADLQAVLDKDLAEALKTGRLAPSTGAGVSIAVVEHGVRRVFSYGAAKADSIFEIGSISKTFTGLILSQMVEQGKVKFDEPVRELLPPGTAAKPAGDEITLLDLGTQHSGLPPLPDNFSPANPANPYADYAAANLYAYLAKHGLGRPAKSSFLYSNLGLGLLGQALAVRSGQPYPALLKEEVTDPLGLNDTTVALSPEQQARFIPGDSGDHQPAHAWDFDALAGAGGIRSTAGDMLTYVEANLHADTLKPATPSTSAQSPAARSLSSALTQQHDLRADAMPGMRIALAWLYETESGNYWHNGATGGYSAYAFFNPKGDYAAVVLLNTTVSREGSFADRLGQHISQRLAGKPAISLAN